MRGFIELTKLHVDPAQSICSVLHPEESVTPTKFTIAISNIAAIIPMSDTKNGVTINYYTEISLFNPVVTIKVKETREKIEELCCKGDLHQE